MKLVPVYISHPYGGHTHLLVSATMWASWFAARYYCAPQCSWIVLAAGRCQLTRAQLLLVDRAQVASVDREGGILVLCGDRVSPGMAEERDEMIGPVVDLTVFGAMRPGALDPAYIAAIDAALARHGVERRPS